MRGIVPFILICLAASAAFGDEDPHQAQVNAAMNDAGEILRHDVLSMRLNNDLTVADLIDRSDAKDAFDAVFQNARQIGGTRWLDDQMVQVRLEIRGADVADMLSSVAEKHAAALKIPMPALRDRLNRDFSTRIFSATGTSTSSSAAGRLTPNPDQVAWRGVTEQDRVAAINAARRNAVDRVLDSLSPIEWDNGRLLADALAIPPLRDSLREWLAARPITSIEFRDDLQLRLTLSASAAEFWPVLLAALKTQGAVLAPHAKDGWEKLHAIVAVRMAVPIGTALAASPGVAVSAIAVPREVPAWAQQSAWAEGISPAVGPKLKTARAAQAIALAALRGKINALPLTPSLTLGDAAAKDPHIAQAITHSLTNARISKVEYDAPAAGAVRIRMTLDLDGVWREVSLR